MIKFKVGQTVEVVDNCGMAAEIGATAVVTSVAYAFCDRIVIDVVWKTNYNNQMNGTYSALHFKPTFRKHQQLLFAFMD